MEDSNAIQTSYGYAWVRMRTALVNCEMANEVLQDFEGWERFEDLKALCAEITAHRDALDLTVQEIERMNKEQFGKLPMR